MRTHLALARTPAPSSRRPTGAGAPGRARPEVRRILHGPTVRRDPLPGSAEPGRRPAAEERSREGTPAPARQGASPASSPGKVCLTFDDGPQKGTRECLDALAAAGAPGTFFLTGKNMAADKPQQKLLVERMISEGHQLGNHTFTHDPQAHAEYVKAYGDLGDPAKLAKFEKNFNDNESHFRALLGSSSPLFSLARLPGDGRFVKAGGKLVYVKHTESMGMAHVSWHFEFGTSKLSGKVEKPSFKHLTAFPWQGIAGVSADHAGLPRGGDVILLHDRHWAGKQASLAAVIAKLQKEGFGFGKLDASGKCG